MTPAPTSAAVSSLPWSGPYPGLRPFFQEDAPRFFGRGRQTNQMLERLEDHRFLGVVGVSGCGKSSLVHAGLLPALEQGYLMDAPAHWRMVKLRPGDAPLQNLAQALHEALRAPAEDAAEHLTGTSLTLNRLCAGRFGLLEAMADARLPDDTAVLVLVDQFEEIFRYRERDHDVRSATASQSQYERHNESLAFVNLLLTAAAQTERPVYVVLTMRSDFLGDCDLFRGLPEAINQSQFLTPRMTRDQLREAIVGPLKMFRAEAEPSLVDLILNEIGADPDQLPLMQHALLRTWQKAVRKPDADGDTICLKVDDYTAVGGIQRALSNHADEAVAERLGLPLENVLGVETERIREALPADEQRSQLRTIELLFRSLCEPKEEGPAVRRIVSVEEVLAAVSDNPGQQQFDDLVTVVEAFRAEGRNFLFTTPQGEITRETKLDISHEALLRQWTRLNQEWIPREIEAARQFRHYAEEARRWEEGQGGLLAGDSLHFALAWWDSQRPTDAWIARYVRQPSLLRDFLADSRTEDARLQARKLGWRRARIALFAVVCISLIVAVISLFLAVRSEAEATAAKEEVKQSFARICLANGGTAIGSEKNEQDTRDIAKGLAWYGQAFVAAKKGSRESESARRLIASWSNELGRTVLQDGPVVAVAFSPNGRMLATANEDGIAQLWDAATGEPRGAPMTHGHGIKTVSFSLDGRRLVTAGGIVRLTNVTVVAEGFARLWDAATGEPLGGPLRHDAPVRAAAFGYPDGRMLATASDDKTARRWDVATGQPCGEPLGHEGPVRTVTFSPDGRMLATASDDKTARRWDAATGQPIGEPLKHDGAVLAVKFSPDGHTLVTTGSDRTARLWDAATGQPRGGPLKLDGIVEELSFSADSRKLITAGRSGASVWEIASGRPEGTSLTYGGDFVALSPDGRILANATVSAVCKLWDVFGRRAFGRPLRHEGYLTAMTLSPDGRTLATASHAGTARLWNAELGPPSERLLKHGGFVLDSSFSADAKTIATACDDSTARLWNAVDGQPLAEPFRHEESVTSVSLTSDGRLLATGSGNAVGLWDTTTVQRQWEGRRHKGRVTAVSFSPDARTLASAGEDTNVCIWDVATGQAVGEPLKHDTAVSGISFFPNGRTLATSSGSEVRLWDVTTGKLQGKPLKHAAAVHNVTVCPDGHTLATIGPFGVSLWDVTIGKLRGEPLKHDSTVTAATFSPDGCTLATASDHAARLWDVATGQMCGEPLKQEGYVDNVTFSSDGRSLATLTEHEDTAELHRAGTQPSGNPLGSRTQFVTVPLAPDAFAPNASKYWYIAKQWEIPPPAADTDDPPERSWLSIQYRTTLTIEEGVVRRLSQAEWLKCWDDLQRLGGPNDVRMWDQVSPRERALLKRP